MNDELSRYRNPVRRATCTDNPPTFSAVVLSVPEGESSTTNWTLRDLGVWLPSWWSEIPLMAPMRTSKARYTWKRPLGANARILNIERDRRQCSAGTDARTKSSRSPITNPRRRDTVASSIRPPPVDILSRLLQPPLPIRSHHCRPSHSSSGTFQLILLRARNLPQEILQCLSLSAR